MKQALQNSMQSGKLPNSNNRFQALRLYIVFGSLVILTVFGIYTQFLIQSARKDQEYIPRLFAQYIAYTDRYIKDSERYTQILTDVITHYLQFASETHFKQMMWDYIQTDFMGSNPIPMIITDANHIPTVWYRINVSSDTLYEDLSPASQTIINKQLRMMNSMPLYDEKDIIGYAYFAKPISFEQFMQKIDYSIVVTDRNKLPLYWRNIGVTERFRYNQLSLKEKQQLNNRQTDMFEIPLSNEADSLGYIYFSTHTSLSQIRNMVYLEFVLLACFILFGGYGLMLIRKSEKDTLWVGLAKETAHQFGTPITALMGWIDYLKERTKDSSNEKEYTRIIELMTTDLNHLNNIAQRFGKVGSTIKLVPHDLDEVLTEISDYYRKRLPHIGSKIEIHKISKLDGIKVMMDVELIKWTLENLIKNCIDAMSTKGGNIIITASKKSHYVYLHIRDEGKGIPRSMWKKIFEPGTTTKSRGWGLGLSLAKRIIEEYHHGKIRVVDSTIGEGTTIEIILHTESKEV